MAHIAVSVHTLEL